jgi:hypothetical protein
VYNPDRVAAHPDNPVVPKAAILARWTCNPAPLLPAATRHRRDQ